MNKMIPIVSATVLGITIMLLPILLVTPAYWDKQLEVTSTESFSTDLNEKVRTAQTAGKSDIGALAFPSSIIHAGLVVILGLIIAFSTSLLYIKKKRF